MPELYPAPQIDTRPTSGLAITSMVLGILSLCAGPLGLVPLILGIVGIKQTGKNGSRQGMGFAIAGTALGGLALLSTLLWVVIMLPALATGMQAARHQANILKSSSQVRMLMQGVMMYANENDDSFPPVDGWEQALLDAGHIEQEWLLSPTEDGDGISYIYLGGEMTFDAAQIVIYEDPKHWAEKGTVIVGFADAHVDWIPLAEFEQMLAEQSEEP